MRQAKIILHRQVPCLISLYLACFSFALLASLPLGNAPAFAAADKVSKYDGMPEMLVPAGEFTMGADDADAFGRRDEFPPHRVRLSAYWIDKYEVSNAQFVRFLNSRVKGNRPQIYSYCDLGNPYCKIRWDAQTGNCVVEKGFENYPVCAVSWYGASAYAQSMHRRLPTEAEWEKAARGTDQRRYPWGNDWLPQNTNTRDSGPGGPVPVGSRPKDCSPYVVMDMAGNVREWVQDGWDADFYKTSPVDDPDNEISRSHRVVRGGAFCLTEWDSRTTSRQLLIPSVERRYMGFRCAETVPTPLPAPLKVSDDVLFYAPLDGYAYAAAAQGDRHPEESPKEPEYVPGHRGKAILVGDVNGGIQYVRYAADGNFDLKEGTISLWIQPHGWNGTDKGYRYLFMILDVPTCKFYLYRFDVKNLTVLAGNGIEGQWGSTGCSTEKWKDGQWIHLAVTWKDRTVRLYVDGRLAGTTVVPTEKYFRGMPPSFTLGFPDTWDPQGKKAATAIDDFVIFSKALSPEEIVKERDRQGAP